jgi:predicted transcriptional regulator
LAAVILVKGLQPADDTLHHSEEEGVPLLGTEMEAFEIAGKLYKELNAEIL